MTQFLKITGYEYRMAIRRRGVWLAFALAAGFFMLIYFTSYRGEDGASPAEAARHTAAQITFLLNAILGVLAGVVISDRIARDRKLAVAELQNSTPLSRWTYLLSKYIAALVTVLIPAGIINLLMVSMAYFIHPELPLNLFSTALFAFLTIMLPSFIFLTAFSLVCPLVMPVRIYQILFTGYWFWGNYLHPRVMPTLSSTPLSASGKFALQAFFGVNMILDDPVYTVKDALLNIGVLVLCALAALTVTKIYLAWQDRSA